MSDKLYCPNAIFSGDETKCAKDGQVDSEENANCCWHDDEGKNIPSDCGKITDGKERKTCIMLYRTAVSALENETKLNLNDRKIKADEIMTVYKSMMSADVESETNIEITPNLTKAELKEIIETIYPTTLNAGIESLKDDNAEAELPKTTKDLIIMFIDNIEENGVEMRIIRYIIKKLQRAGQHGGGRYGLRALHIFITACVGALVVGTSGMILILCLPGYAICAGAGKYWYDLKRKAWWSYEALQKRAANKVLESEQSLNECNSTSCSNRNAIKQEGLIRVNEYSELLNHNFKQGDYYNDNLIQAKNLADYLIKDKKKKFINDENKEFINNEIDELKKKFTIITTPISITTPIRINVKPKRKGGTKGLKTKRRKRRKSKRHKSKRRKSKRRKTKKK